MKLPNPKKLNSGNWRVQVMVDGERVSFTAPTKTECIEQAVLLKAKTITGNSDSNLISLRRGLTTGQIIDLYIESKEGVLSPSTVWKYKQIRETHFQDIMDIKASAVSNWQKVVSDESKKGYSAKTIGNAWSLVHSALKNVGVKVDDIVLPQKIKKERTFLDYEQILTFVKAIEGSDIEMGALLALHSLRRSELLAMTKDKVEGNILHVYGAKVNGENSKLVYKETNKTSKSRRNIPIMIPRLQTLIDEFKGDGPLCTWGGTKMVTGIHKVCEENGLPVVGLHGLRHSFASLCYHLQIPELETMRLGGWNNPTVLREIYTHLAEKDNRLAEEKIRNFFSES